MRLHHRFRLTLTGSTSHFLTRDTLHDDFAPLHSAHTARRGVHPWSPANLGHRHFGGAWSPWTFEADGQL